MYIIVVDGIKHEADFFGSLLKICTKLKSWLVLFCAQHAWLLEDRVFIFGPRCVCVVSYLLVKAKIIIWLIRRNKIKGPGCFGAKRCLWCGGCRFQNDVELKSVRLY